MLSTTSLFFVMKWQIVLHVLVSVRLTEEWIYWQTSQEKKYILPLLRLQNPLYIRYYWFTTLYR